MTQYILRLDDACEKMDICKWDRMESLLDLYNVKPLVGVIPHCEDEKMGCYKTDTNFWQKVKKWQNKGWEIAMHGYNHVYITTFGGINPVNHRSEFAGVSIEEQKNKIKQASEIFASHGIEPKVFFAPSHTFDENTLQAIKEESNIRIISDTVAFDVYQKGDFVFVPQQSGRVRKLPFKTVTFCYHPNMMEDNDFIILEEFLKKYKFFDFPILKSSRKKNLLDIVLQKIYLKRHKK